MAKSLNIDGLVESTPEEIAGAQLLLHALTKEARKPQNAGKYLVAYLHEGEMHVGHFSKRAEAISFRDTLQKNQRYESMQPHHVDDRKCGHAC